MIYLPLIFLKYSYAKGVINGYKNNIQLNGTIKQSIYSHEKLY